MAPALSELVSRLWAQHGTWLENSRMMKMMDNKEGRRSLRCPVEAAWRWYYTAWEAPDQRDRSDGCH
jgi:hypothetical protein